MRPIDADALRENMKFVCMGVMAGTEPYAAPLTEIDNAPTIEPEQQWIPCSERLPKQGKEVICQCRANIIKVLKLDADGDWYQDAYHCYMGGFVIAWMPLPEPWRGEEHGQSRE